ncbi:MAG: mobile mystery protein A [Fimbriimonadaceae bacterium]|nr:mobile mystery protein A [Fimbriimonadaceae bacterium]
MDNKRQSLRRQQLDRQLLPLRDVLPPSAPPGGWVKAIREALGMNLPAFARRLGIAASTAYQLEQAEASGSITLNRLKGAAAAVECDVFVVLVPRSSLNEVVESRAREKALNRLQRVGHTMSIEDQAVSQEEFEDMVKEAASEIRYSGEKIWD